MVLAQNPNTSELYYMQFLGYFADIDKVFVAEQKSPFRSACQGIGYTLRVQGRVGVSLISLR